MLAGGSRSAPVSPAASPNLPSKADLHAKQCGFDSTRLAPCVWKGSECIAIERRAGSRHVECYLAGGKEPELVREVERYRLEIVGLTSTHSVGLWNPSPGEGGLASLLLWSGPRGEAAGWLGVCLFPPSSPRLVLGFLPQWMRAYGLSG
ncbi:hypothetical protein CRENBAI_018393 [Crenichthys baileyi]|uniref:Uncharacterized protein n=1 Tax=Crenichthys baileyi TaxID=28760 RepID=A0AAV9R5R5_9TELE